MANLPAVTKDKYNLAPISTMQEFVTMRLGDEMFGISVMAVQDVLRKQKVAHVPLAPHIVAGSLNLRGRIVTVIDMRRVLGMPSLDASENTMHVVAEYQGELYSLMVDRVGEVLSFPLDKLERSPANLAESWRDIAAGVFKMKEDILVILDTQSLLSQQG